MRAVCATFNLADKVVVGLRAQDIDLATVTWDALAERLHAVFCPADWKQRARDQLDRCQMQDSAAGYTVAFCKALLRCMNVSP